MYSRKLLVLLFVISLIAAAGCGKKASEKQMEQAAQKMEQAANELAEAGESMGDNAAESVEDMAAALKKMGEAMGGVADSAVEPIDFRELKALLPEKVSGLNRTNASGEKNSAFGIKVSKAEGAYSNDEGQSVNIIITDMGSIKGLAGFAQYGWAMAEVDRESDTGYEKTMTFKGCRGYEEYQSDNQWGQIQLLVEKRFVVEISGSSVKMDMLKDALNSIDIDKLKKMKNSGV